MSLINQMLQDLDARRASGAELALVPRYVRALPRPERSRTPWWLAAAGAAIGIAGAAAWHITQAPAPVAAGLSPAQPRPAQGSAAPDAIAAAPMPSAPAPAAASMPSAPPTPAAAPVPTSVVIAREMPGAAFRALPIDQPQTAAAPAARSAEAPTPAPAVRSAEAPAPAPKSARAAPPVGDKGAASAEAAAPPTIDKRVPQPSVRELADREFREATTLLHQGRRAEAQEKFRLALQHLPGHGAARQALFGLLLEARQLTEAEQVLQEGLRADSAQPHFAMALARMQVDRGDTAGAVETLQRSASAAHGKADYIAFLAALMQRQGRHTEAVEHYQSVLALAPGSGLWSMGLGISLQALQRNAEARAAYRRALASHALSPELNAYIDQQLRLLQ